MPVQTTYPGIYIEELSSSTHTITAAPTSKTVFVGYTHPFKTQQFGKPIELFSFTDYQTWFGGFFRSSAFDAESGSFGDVAQAVNQFFLNGGANAYVIGLQAKPAGQPISPATATIGPLVLSAREIIDADHQMQVTISNVSRLRHVPCPSRRRRGLTIPVLIPCPYSNAGRRDRRRNHLVRAAPLVAALGSRLRDGDLPAGQYQPDHGRR